MPLCCFAEMSGRLSSLRFARRMFRLWLAIPLFELCMCFDWCITTNRFTPSQNKKRRLVSLRCGYTLLRETYPKGHMTGTSTECASSTRFWPGSLFLFHCDECLRWQQQRREPCSAAPDSLVGVERQPSFSRQAEFQTAARVRASPRENSVYARSTLYYAPLSTCGVHP